MHGIIDELRALVSQGHALMLVREPELIALQEWVAKRGRVLQNLESLGTEWSVPEREASHALIAQILAFDATLIPCLEARLKSLGKEILGARKIRLALGNHCKAGPHSSRLLERTV